MDAQGLRSAAWTGWYTSRRSRQAITEPPTGVKSKAEAGEHASRPENKDNKMNMHAFSVANSIRCESPTGFNHKLKDWSTSDWFTAVLGELGEAANVAKKLNRVRDGIPGNKETTEDLREKLANELADTYIYLDLLCQRENIDLPLAILKVFKAKSQQIGYDDPLIANLERQVHGD